MADLTLPTYRDLLLPTLVALDHLGGSGTRDEIDGAVPEIAGLSDDQLAVEFPPDAARQKGSKVIHRLAWARTYLKKFGALDNSQRGIWTLEPVGRQYLEMEPGEASTKLRAADTEVRRQHRSVGLTIVEGASQEDAEESDEELIALDNSEPVDSASVAWQDRLLAKLLEIRPDAFERLAQRLLREAGFKNVEVLGRSGDGGLDGVGVYRPSLISFPIFFQCKRYRDSVGPAQVRDFRGAMSGRGEKGLLITTGVFTTEAKREATRDGAPPVELVDGADLCDLLREYSVGVATRTVQIVEVHEQFFDSL